jgi:hypothetical protein
VVVADDKTVKRFQQKLFQFVEEDVQCDDSDFLVN